MKLNQTLTRFSHHIDSGAYMRRIFLLMMIVCVSLFVACASTPKTELAGNQSTENQDDFIHLWTHPDYDVQASIIREADDTQLAKLADDEKVYLTEEFTVTYRKIKALDFLSITEQNELLQKYLARNPMRFDNGTEVQIEISEETKLKKADSTPKTEKADNQKTENQDDFIHLWTHPDYDVQASIIREVDDTQLAKLADGEKVYVTEEFTIAYRKIKALDFLSIAEQNELLQKYLSRNPIRFDNGTEIQIEISEDTYRQ